MTIIIRKITAIQMCLLLIIGVWFILPCSVYAENSLISDHLLKEGIKHLNAGKKDKAIHEFSKALLANSKNEEAKEYLDKLGIRSSVYGMPESPLERVSRLTHEIDGYKDKVATLEFQNDEKHHQRMALAAEKDKLIMVIASKETKVRLLMDDINALAEEIKAEQDETRQLKALSHQHIAELNTDIYDLKSQLSSKIVDVKEKEGEVREVKNRANEWRQKLRLNQKSAKRAAIAQKGEIRSVEKNFRNFKSNAAKADLNKEKLIRELNDAIYQKNNDIALMSDKLIFHNEKILTNRERALAKEKKIQELKNSVYVLEDEINTLRARMREQKRLDRRLSEKIADEDPNIDLAKVKLIKRQDKLIEEYKGKLINMKDQGISIDETVVLDKEGRIDALNKELRQMKTKIRLAEKSLEQKTNEYDLIEARLDDTQQRLELVNKMLQDRDNQIKELEDQITGALNQFDDKL